MTIRKLFALSIIQLTQISSMHVKCRNSEYPRSGGIVRTPVPDDKVYWKTPWLEYAPVSYTSKNLKGQEWADPELPTSGFAPVWNSFDGKVNRASHIGKYDVIDGTPLNPEGRTGISGRGCLGRWGPNHAGDPIVTRWKRTEEGKRVVGENSGSFVLQFVAIQRRDCNEWAIPGGMVDPGEVVSSTLRREFLEEALNSLEIKDNQTEEMVEKFFENGIMVYKGYVDDPRNTDNAWMETVAYNFHDEDGSTVGKLPLQAGDDAGNVTWMDLRSDIQLYASHRDMLKTVCSTHGAYW